MSPGGYDIIIDHGMSVEVALELVVTYFSKLWPLFVPKQCESSCVGGLEVFIHKDEETERRIDAEGVVNEPGFVHILSYPGQMTVVVEDLDEFGKRCKDEITRMLHVNLGL